MQHYSFSSSYYHYKHPGKISSALTQLIDKARTGDEQARSQLYVHNANEIFSICIRMMGNRNDAKDVMQETFITAFVKLHQLKNSGSFTGWLKRIAIHECIRQKKIHFKQLELSIQETDKNETTDTDNWWLAIDIDQLHDEIKTLPEGYRQVFTLFAIEDFSHMEIAGLMGISESTSKSQYHRAKKILKNRLHKYKYNNG